MTQYNALVLHLSLINGVGPVTVRRITTWCATNNVPLDHIYSLRASDFQTACGMSERLAAALVSGLAQKKLLDQERALMQKHQIGWITENDQLYPALLREIPVPPVGLYVRGDFSVLNQQGVSFVGSRAADAYGSEVARRMAEGMAEQDLVTVSGGARGIDAMIHQYTLRSRGKTIAVLGSGLLRPYPREHGKLFDAIAEHGGLVISSFSLCEPARGSHFPCRNRLIAGLTPVTIVLQAAARSGALITAQYAVDFSRDVGAVPGEIRSELSAGCHGLIQQGAALISSPEDVLALLPGKIVSNEVIAGRTEHKPKKSIPASIQADKAPPDILCRYLAQKPCSFDELVVYTSCDPAELYSRLQGLQLKGAVTQNFAGLWQLA